MAVFAYRALDEKATVVTGTVVADTARHVRDQLRARGLSVEAVTARGGAEAGGNLNGLKAGRGGRRHGTQVVTFVRELATLLGVGIPLLEALDTLSAQYTGPFRSVLLGLQDRVASGLSLAGAMREQPRIFDELAVSVAEVGETSGTLDSVLERLADFQERRAALRNRVGTALIYPAIVLLVTIGVTLLLMTFVVPKLLGTLLQAGMPVPWVTRIVKGASDGLVDWWWLLLTGVGLVVAGTIVALNTAAGRRWWHATQLRLPVFGELIRKQAIARLAIVMSILLRSGVVFVRALQIAQRTTSNLILREALARCEAAVGAGADLASALRGTAAFPPMVVKIFSVGQESGRLEDMLDRLAIDYDRQTATLTTRLTAILEPTLILLMVVIVGLVAFATVLPMLEAANAF